MNIILDKHNFAIGKVIFSWLFLLVAHAIHAQGTIGGSTSVLAGTNTNYSWVNDVIYPSPNWQVTGGSVLSSGSSGAGPFTYSSTVRFDGPAGTYTVSFLSGSTVISTLSVTVTCRSTPTPTATFSYAYNCGNTVITAIGTPPSGLAWYWQTSPTGTNQTFSSTNPFTVTTSGTYYVRANRTSSTGCWGTGQPTAPVTVNSQPIASVANKWICSNQNTSLPITNTNGVPGTTFSWTVIASNVNGAISGTGNVISQVLTVTDGINPGTATYTITPSANGCIGPTTSATVTVNPIPLFTNLPATSVFCGSGQLDFTALTNTSSSSTTVFWDRSVSGSVDLPPVTGAWGPVRDIPQNTGSVVGTVTYTFYPTYSGTTCSGPSAIYTVTVNPTPTAPSVSSASLCGSGNITATPGANANSVNWYLVPTGGASVTSITSPNTTATTTYYVTSYNTSTFCESAAPRQPVTIAINQMPGVPILKSTTVCGTGSVTALPGNYGNVVKWYANSTGGAPVVSGEKSPVVNSPITYYAATAINWLPGCESARVAVPITITCFNENYVLTNLIQVDNITLPTQIPPLEAEKNQQSIQYVDGLGRLKQFVGRQASRLKNDLVQTNFYDGFGRESRKYLPITVNGSTDGGFKPNLIDLNTGNYINQALNYYNNGLSDKITDDPRPFAETLFEPSPLNRPAKDFGAGQAWYANGRAVQHAYLVNVHGTAAGQEKIIAWTIVNNLPVRSAALANYIVAGGYYATGQLTVKSTKDEQGNEVREYTDKEGRTILKKVQAVPTGTPLFSLSNANHWAQTYYIYDDLGNLRFVLQPVLSRTIHLDNTNTLNPTAADLANFAFQYTYDARRRMATKQVPGAQPVYMVYDSRDRLVLTQDGNQRAGAANTVKYWAFTKYDELNRPILTGIKDTTIATATTLLTQAQMQAAVDAHYAKASARWGEAYIGSAAGNLHGYSNRSYPVRTGAATEADPNKYLTVTYYDNYNFKTQWAGNYNYLDESLGEAANGSTYTQPATESSMTLGLATGGKTKVLDGGVTGGHTWLKAVTYYDDKGRAVQTLSDNYKGGTDRATTVVDFVGKALKTKTTHTTGNVTWKDLSGASVTGNRLTRTATVAAGAASVQTLGAGQNGWMEVTVSETTTNKYVGFNDTNPDVGFANIDYAFYLNGTTLRIMENNVARLTQTGALRPGDILKIERAGSAVKYYRNGTQLSYQNNAAISTALMVDASLQSNNATLVGVRLQAASGLTWKDQVGVAATGGTLAGTAPSGWGNSGAASVETLPANTNGWLEVANTQPDTHRMIGLSSANANASYETIQYALYLTGDQFTVYENGAQQPVLRPLAVGDVLRVERTGGTVRYYQNGALAYTSPVPCSAALLADASIYSQGGRLEGIRASFAGAGGGRTVTKRMQYDHAGRLLRTHHQINGGAEVLLSALEYNELGEEVTKKLHSTDNGSTFKQSVDYRYNIRGWMTSINNSSLANDGGATNSDTNDLFGMNLYYNQVVAGINNVADYTGNISAVAWSNYLSQSGIKERGYRFLYDELNRLSAATHVEKTSAWASSTSLHEDNLTYDHNGNIKTLNRKGAGASALDIMVYNYGSGTTLSNKMLSITDNGDKAKGFLDNNTTGNDYTYDNNGSQLTDKNKGITATVYNHFNQPTKVTVTNGDYMTYTYDGAGARLGKGLYNSANLLKRQTDYVGDFVYENDTLKFIRHGDGRIMMTGASAEYQYELRDNKDNVRVMFTSQPLQDIATATYEPANATAEQGKYLRYTSAKMVNSSLFDKTNGSAPSLATGYAQRLNGSANEKYGVARSISVMPGDVVKAEVYAKYVDPNTSNWNGALNALMSQIASGTAGVVVDGANYSTSTSTFPAAYPNLVSKTDNGAPKAYLNWLVFDRDFVFLTGGFQQISTACRETGTDVAHEYLASPDIIIAQPGYVYIYVSNDNATPVDVFFDEVRVTQNASPIVQTNTYYPFGMDIPSLSYQREGNKKNNYLYNGRSELQDDLGLNSYFTPLRIEETDAPRWWQVDPLTDGQESWSPYNYSYDNPIRYNDPRGDCPCLVYPIGIAIVEAAVAVTGGTLTYLTLKQYGKQIFEAMGNGSPYSTPAVSFAQTTGGANSLNSESKKPKGSNNPTTKESAETGQEAHRQEQKKLKEQGAETEVPMELKDGTKVRKDAVKPDGTAVIIKPDTPTGRKSAAKREKLMEKNEKKTETILYDPKDPKYKPDSPTYIGPKKD